jgi:hypothetical protein
MPDVMWHSEKNLHLSFRHAFDDPIESANGNRVAGKEENPEAPESKSEQRDNDEIASSEFHVVVTTPNS